MRFTTSLALGALATLASAQVIIYDEDEYAGEQVTFAPDGTCHTIFPWISSIYFPDNQDIFCQFFDKPECTGDGGDVTLNSVLEFEDDEIWPGVICGVFSD